MKRFILLFILLILSSSLVAKEIFVIRDNSKTKIDLTEHVEYYETETRFWSGQNASYRDLTKARWKKSLQNEQSYIKGFWIKLTLHNETDKLYFGLGHENLNKAIVYAEVRNNVEKHVLQIFP